MQILKSFFFKYAGNGPETKINWLQNIAKVVWGGGAICRNVTNKKFPNYAQQKEKISQKH